MHATDLILPPSARTQQLDAHSARTDPSQQQETHEYQWPNDYAACLLVCREPKPSLPSRLALKPSGGH